MAFRTRRQNRYLKLRNAGFLPGEARPLSRVPFKRAPYTKEMFADRQKMVQKVVADMKGASGTAIAKELEQRVKKLYDTNRWTSLGRRGIYRDAWKMLRDYEDRWRDKFPQYTSPWQPRRRDFLNYVAKAERTIEAQKRQA